MGNYSKISLLFFLLIAVLGTLIRLFPFFDVPLAYKHLLHAHSHVAFQGWIYTLIMLFTTHLFLTPSQIKKGHYITQFKITVGIVVGILVSFSLQGYGLYSILFSSLFQLLYYGFVFQFLKDVRKHTAAFSLRFIKAGLLLGVLSTLAPWGIGILSAQRLTHTEGYEALLYFFLHFQYNGLFLFVIIGLFFKWLENHSVPYHAKKALLLYNVSIATIFFTYTLSLLGMSFRNDILILATLASLLQWIELRLLCSIFIPAYNKEPIKQHPVTRLLLIIIGVCFTLKVLLQSLSILPSLQEYAFTNRFIIMAYMHLNFIGIISFSFLLFLFYWKWLRIHWIAITGIFTLLGGFIGSELLLVMMGFQFYSSSILLLLFSFFMIIGISFLLIGNFKKG